MIYHHAITPSADNFSRSIFWRLYRFHHRSVSLFRKRRYLSKQSKVSGHIRVNFSSWKIFSELSYFLLKIGLIFLQPLTMQTARIPTPPSRISTIMSPTWNLMTRICCNKNIRKMTTVSFSQCFKKVAKKSLNFFPNFFQNRNRDIFPQKFGWFQICNLTIFFSRLFSKASEASLNKKKKSRKFVILAQIFNLNFHAKNNLKLGTFFELRHFRPIFKHSVL